jgi:hypothetical protein
MVLIKILEKFLKSRGFKEFLPFLPVDEVRRKLVSLMLTNPIFLVL